MHARWNGKSTTIPYSTTIYVPSCGYLIFIFIIFLLRNRFGVRERELKHAFKREKPYLRCCFLSYFGVLLIHAVVYLPRFAWAIISVHCLARTRTNLSFMFNA